MNSLSDYSENWLLFNFFFIQHLSTPIKTNKKPTFALLLPSHHHHHYLYYYHLDFCWMFTSFHAVVSTFSHNAVTMAQLEKELRTIVGHDNIPILLVRAEWWNCCIRYTSTSKRKEKKSIDTRRTREVRERFDVSTETTLVFPRFTKVRIQQRENVDKWS